MCDKPHSDCEHGPGVLWVLEPTRRWLARCDTCHRLRLWADYFEVYAEGEGHCWWWECERCLLKTITASVERLARESSDRTLREKEPC